MQTPAIFTDQSIHACRKPVSICTGAAQARKHRVRVDASATQITTPSTQPRASATNNHARKSSCAGWGPIAAQQLPALSDLSNWVPPPHSARPLHGRSVHAGSICGHWPAPKPSRIPSPACMHKHGKLARVRWPRVPISGVYPYRRRSDGATKSDEGLLTSLLQLNLLARLFWGKCHPFR